VEGESRAKLVGLLLERVETVLMSPRSFAMSILGIVLAMRFTLSYKTSA